MHLLSSCIKKQYVQYQIASRNGRRHGCPWATILVSPRVIQTLLTSYLIQNSVYTERGPIGTSRAHAEYKTLGGLGGIHDALLVEAAHPRPSPFRFPCSSGVRFKRLCRPAVCTPELSLAPNPKI